MPIDFLEQVIGQLKIGVRHIALAYCLADLKQKAAIVNTKEEERNKELVCIFLGLNFYASPERARMLKSRVTDILLRSLGKEDLIGIDVRPAVDFTPTFSKIKKRK